MSGIKVRSDTWRELVRLGKEKRENLIQSIVNNDDHDETQILRGKLRMLDEILDIPEEIKRAAEIKASADSDEGYDLGTGEDDG